MKLTDEMRGVLLDVAHCGGHSAYDVSIESIFLAGYRMGQRDMRERAAKACEDWPIGRLATDALRRCVEDDCAEAIRNLSVEES